MTVDALGGVFSDLSLAFKPDFDVLACCTYTAAAVSLGILYSHPTSLFQFI